MKSTKIQSCNAHEVFLFALPSHYGKRIYGAEEQNSIKYPWAPKTSTHKTPYKISGDI
ncbi:uncharacterized protein LOC108033418 [Drosophila biarmipes]|uniref:uncharacterized protein LOC108033418 n=1 Tax=Drosophila biarmipes TaxID=125945 RepID=UPI0007E7438B|nr:uncharacterized protein LOC108033418 [Drosophila biarmipes]